MPNPLLRAGEKVATPASLKGGGYPPPSPLLSRLREEEKDGTLLREGEKGSHFRQTKMIIRDTLHLN